MHNEPWSTLDPSVACAVAHGQTCAVAPQLGRRYDFDARGSGALYARDECVTQHKIPTFNVRPLVVNVTVARGVSARDEVLRAPVSSKTPELMVTMEPVPTQDCETA